MPGASGLPVRVARSYSARDLAGRFRTAWRWNPWQNPPVPTGLEDRILDCIRSGSRAEFENLAAELIGRQRSPDNRVSWRKLEPEPPNTTRPRAEPALLRAALDLQLPPAPASGLRVLLVAPADNTAADTTGRDALIETVSEIHPLEELNPPGAATDLVALRSWLGSRQRDGRPLEFVATSAGLARALAFLERRRLRFRLPAESRLWLLVAGRPRLNQDPADESDWWPAAQERLGLAPERIRRLLYRSEGSALVERPSAGADGRGVFPLPHWMAAVETSSGIALLDLVRTSGGAYRIEELDVELDTELENGSLRLRNG